MGKRVALRYSLGIEMLWYGTFKGSRTGAEHLLLRGSWAGASVAVTLKRLDETNLPLIQCERRWIDGFP